ncbi:MAG TPA: YggS family pyridoxal phosphate-dependent enzyme [Elusimicrobia bacterium]|nr:YggS family pyridoxal phosphate-dependent enzyme [Elusimicrobiota bacterium]
MVLERLSEIQRRIEQAAQRCDRDPSKVELMAVVKYAATEDVRTLLRSGRLRFCAESRVQDAQRRRAELGEDAGKASWRFIGHLQTNKARAAAELFDSIDSVDSLKLARALDKQLADAGAQKKVLLQVKLSSRETQSGILPEELDAFKAALRETPRLKPCGMMAILPMIEPVEAVRPFCKEFKKIFDRHFPEDSIPERFLSAGMSRDYEIAVEEGANLLRIGTALFEG